MTDEELDRARSDEARKIHGGIFAVDVGRIGEIAARLAREGWMPVDPDLIEARECAALAWKDKGYNTCSAQVLRGEVDNSREVQSALIAIKRAKDSPNDHA
jgi:hypothetical protein